MPPPFDDIFDHAPGGMLLARLDGDHAGRLIRVNAALSRITGYSRRQLLGMTLADLTHPSQLATHRRRLLEVAGGTRTRSSVRRRWIRSDGREVVVQLNVCAVGVGDDRQLFGMVDDLSGRPRAAPALPEQAAHDPLTGLPNVELLAGRIEQSLHACDDHRAVALVHVEVDDLDVCRDVFGPVVADELIALVARRLAENVRPADTVARGGPTHFIVMCPDFRAPASDPSSCRPPEDRAPVGLVERLTAVLAAPYRLGGIVHHLPVRLGRVTAPSGSASASDLLAAVRRAVPAAPTHPGSGSAQAAFRAAPALLGTAAATRHIDLENEVLRAVQEGELVMFGQPVITVATGGIDAVEMLIRWRHPVRGLLVPADFLAVAESGPLMDEVDRRVLSESCRIAAGWSAPAGRTPPAVFVNVSGRQLGSGRLAADVEAALAGAGLSPDRLVLELTETAAPMISGTLRADLAALRRRGIRIAIDDLGTGYSTLARLTELPVDILKIDRTFIAGMGRRRSADAVVRAIMQISRTLGAPVVAEGVETADQAAAVAAHGCQLAQGFLFARPVSEAELTALLAHPAVPG